MSYQLRAKMRPRKRCTCRYRNNRVRLRYIYISFFVLFSTRSQPVWPRLLLFCSLFFLSYISTTDRVISGSVAWRSSNIKDLSSVSLVERNLFWNGGTAGVFQSRQTSSPTNLSPTSLPQAGRLSFSQDQTSAQVNILAILYGTQYRVLRECCCTCQLYSRQRCVFLHRSLWSIRVLFSILVTLIEKFALDWSDSILQMP